MTDRLFRSPTATLLPWLFVAAVIALGLAGCAEPPAQTVSCPPGIVLHVDVTPGHAEFHCGGHQ